jgi:hypothetical protein
MKPSRSIGLLEVWQARACNQCKPGERNKLLVPGISSTIRRAELDFADDGDSVKRSIIKI